MELKNQFDHTDEFLEDIEYQIIETSDNVKESCVDGRLELPDDGMNNMIYVKECLEQALQLIRVTREMNNSKEYQI